MAKKLPAGSTAIVGVGTTRYGNLPGLDQYDLGAWALKEALADAGLTLRDIDGLIVSRIADWHRPALVRGDVPGHAANELLDAADSALDFISQVRKLMKG